MDNNAQVAASSVGVVHVHTTEWCGLLVLLVVMVVWALEWCVLELLVFSVAAVLRARLAALSALAFTAAPPALMELFWRSFGSMCSPLLQCLQPARVWPLSTSSRKIYHHRMATGPLGSLALEHRKSSVEHEGPGSRPSLLTQSELDLEL